MQLKKKRNNPEKCFEKKNFLGTIFGHVLKIKLKANYVIEN